MNFISLYKLIFFLPVLIIVSAASVFPQKNNFHWQKQEHQYAIPIQDKPRDYNISIHSVADVITKPLLVAYWFLISDVDGDRCPFTPSCSAFFAEAVKETNIIEGALLFADRFIRDAAVFNRDQLYRFDEKKMRYLDPVQDYIFNEEK